MSLNLHRYIIDKIKLIISYHNLNITGQTITNKLLCFVFAHGFLVIYGTTKNDKFPLSKWTSNTSFDQLSFTDDQQIKAKTTLVVHSERYLSLVLSLHMKAKKILFIATFRLWCGGEPCCWWASCQTLCLAGSHAIYGHSFLIKAVSLLRTKYICPTSEIFWLM